MPSAPRVEDDKKLVTVELIKRQGLFSHPKWVSNDVDVIADVKEEARAAETDLKKTELPTTKTLGVLWSAADDKFFFDTPCSWMDLNRPKKNLTKTATVCDPPGFFDAKSVGWFVAKHHQKEWLKLFQGLSDLYENSDVTVRLIATKSTLAPLSFWVDDQVS